MLAGDKGFALLEEMAPNGRENPTFAVRTRFFDDLLADASDSGLCQVVLIAAGMDTRSYRLAWPAGTAVYEVDQPEVLSGKQHLLDGENAHPTCRRVTVGADLSGEWAPALVAADFDPNRSAVFVAEGLMMYLPEPAVHRLLAEASLLAAPGSSLGVDLQSRTSIEHPWMAEWLQAAASRGMGWQFGTEDPAALLSSHG